MCGGCSGPWCGGARWPLAVLVASAGAPAATAGALDTQLWQLTWNEMGKDLGVRADPISPTPCPYTSYDLYC